MSIEQKVIDTAAQGYERLFSSENIAIVTLALMLLLSLIFIGIQTWKSWKTDELHRAQMKECWEALKEHGTFLNGLREILILLEDRVRRPS